MRRKGRYSIIFHERTEERVKPLLNSRQSCITPFVNAAVSAWWKADGAGFSGSMPATQPGSRFSDRGLWKISGRSALGELVTSISGTLVAGGGALSERPREGML